MKRKITLTILFIFCASLILLTVTGGEYYNKNLKTVSNITIDVNPSIVLSTNYYNRVIKVKALNDDGVTILENLDVAGKTAEEAINIVVEELIEQGYLEGDGANILLTIQNNNLEKAKELETTLSNLVNEKLDNEYIAGTVLTQVETIKKHDPEVIKSLMDDYNISYSKAIFITNVVSKNSTLDVKTLATLKISEISKLINDNGIDIDTIAGHNENDSIYKSAQATQLKKVQAEALKAKNQALESALKIEQKIEEKTKNGEDTKELEKAYEEAKKIKDQAEDLATQATSAYEKVEQIQNAGSNSGIQTNNQNGKDDSSNDQNSSGSNSNKS